MKKQDRIALKRIVRNILKEDAKFANDGSYDTPHKVDDHTINLLKQVFEHFNCDLDSSYIAIGKTIKLITNLLQGDTIDLSNDGATPLHLHPNKWQLTKPYRDMRGEVHGEKLAYRDAEGNRRDDKVPMSMAQYHNMMYQEGRIIKEDRLNNNATPDRISDLDLSWYNNNAYPFIGFGDKLVYPKKGPASTHHEMVAESIAALFGVDLDIATKVEKVYNAIRKDKRLFGYVTDETKDLESQTVDELGEKTFNEMWKYFENPSEWQKKATLFGRIWVDCNDGNNYISIWSENRFSGMGDYRVGNDETGSSIDSSSDGEMFGSLNDYGTSYSWDRWDDSSDDEDESEESDSEEYESDEDDSDEYESDEDDSEDNENKFNWDAVANPDSKDEIGDSTALARLKKALMGSDKSMHENVRKDFWNKMNKLNEIFKRNQQDLYD